MKGTVSSRILAGAILSVVLVVLLALGAIWTLRRTVRGYEEVLRQRREVVVGAYRGESALRAANVDVLRYLNERNERYIADYDSALGVAREVLGEVGSESTNPAAWDRVLALLNRWGAGADSVIAARRAGKDDAAERIRATVTQPTRDQLEATLHQEVQREAALADEQAKASSEAAGRAGGLLALLAVATVLTSIVSGALLRSGITRALRESTSLLASSASEILATTSQQAAGANESLAAVSETVATVNEVAQTAEQSAQRARSMAETAERASEVGQRGRRAIEESVAAMDQLKGQVDKLAGDILGLAEQAQAIGDIIASVNDIAEQTNMLALNAAVEAARAGEQGRSFAVVAAEVKELADQSRKATAEIRRILGDIQRATGAAVMATEQSTRQANQSAKLIGQAGSTIRLLTEEVAGTAQTSALIVASAGQQAIGMDQIREAITNIQEAAQQNLSATRQSEQAARDLNRIGDQLVALVGKPTG